VAVLGPTRAVSYSASTSSNSFHRSCCAELLYMITSRMGFTTVYTCTVNRRDCATSESRAWCWLQETSPSETKRRPSRRPLKGSSSPCSESRNPAHKGNPRRQLTRLLPSPKTGLNAEPRHLLSFTVKLSLGSRGQHTLAARGCQTVWVAGTFTSRLSLV